MEVLGSGSERCRVEGGPSNGLMWMLLPAWVVLGFGSWACSSNQCTGPAIQCTDFVQASCSDVPGCSAGPACVMYEASGQPVCSRMSTQSSCAAPQCSWTGGSADAGCIDVCDTVTDEVTCNSTYSAQTESVGGSHLWGCLWAQCRGTPVKPFCSDYSTAECPTQFGCSVQHVNSF